ncbi:ester cyclase [Thalassococcus sp. BH17M4-6]|uniref:ester cyclase n=1 Tax=Thalassococcus sp. BH17M4-6 TaxID=3413148 RepID=UPI003BC5F44C
MKRFDPKFLDFPDYLDGVTDEVWQQRGLTARMAEYYHPDVIVRRAGGIGFGAGEAAATGLAELAAIPDRMLMTEDVIWTGTAATGYLGAQRILSRGSHRGHGLYGAPSQAPVLFREMVDSYAKDNRICDEWRICDTGAILRQTGQDPAVWARARLAHIDPDTGPLRPEIDATGPYTARGNDSRWGDAFAGIVERIVAAEVSVIAGQYDRACQLAYPGGVTGHGHGAAETFWMGLRSAFPSASFSVHHVMGLEEPLMPPRAALRWSLQGRHDGWGAFGAPTGAEVHVMGMSHAELGPGGVRREWTLIDEAAVWMQILRHQG